jgi:D-alanyl-D-alanine carboxypeptidase/D-alanyl-D-alanine-endopeptidase (penicillin-binding protein 4)
MQFIPKPKLIIFIYLFFQLIIPDIYLMIKKLLVKRLDFHVLWILVVYLSSCAATKYRVDKTPLDKHFALNPVFNESHTGLVVYDPEPKKVLFDYNSQKHFTPASNTKLLTYFAIINTLADSIPSMKYSIQNDTLYFTGAGDGTFLYADYDYSKTFNLLKESPYPLVYVQKPIVDQRFGPGWSWDDYPYYYSAEKAAFPIYGNMLQILMDTTSHMLEVIPRYFEDHLSIIQKENEDESRIFRKEFENEFKLTFRDNPSLIDCEIPFIYSDDLFVQLISDTLDRPVLYSNDFPAGFYQTTMSIPVDSVSKKILIESDNFLAEQMLLNISHQFGDTLSSKRSIDFIVENYLSELKDEIYWVDGSGLSRYNQVTPNAMIRVLEHIYRKIPREELFYMLPESGKTGTLQNAFYGLNGKIHAKTGSMSHVYNLSGYLETKTGKTLLFSFMNNNFNVSFSELKSEMERVLSVFVNEVK